MDVRRSRTTNPDRWLDTCPEDSRATCEQLREWMFRWQPDLAESVNTNMLCYTGRKRVVAIAGFKKYAQMVFFRGTELADPADLFAGGETNTNIRNVTLNSLDEIEGKVTALKHLVQAAVSLDANPDIPPPPPKKREEWPMPEVLGTALKKNKKAAAGFEALKPTYQREWKVYNTGAKQQETIDKRLAETIRALEKGLKWAQRKEA